MKIILNRVVKGEHGENLPETSFSYESGAVTVVAVETAQRPTVLALLATGRMVPDAGTVVLREGDGGGDHNDSSGTVGPTPRDESARLRRATAIVDAPDVSEPVGDLRLAAVVQEELMFAGRPSNRRATAEALDELGAGEYSDWEIQNIPTALRLKVLTELAASRPDVEALVLTAPDRRGSDPFEWWMIAAGLAERGFAVLVIASPASADLLAETASRFEAGRLAELERREAAARAAEAERLTELAGPAAPPAPVGPATQPAPAPAASVPAPAAPSVAAAPAAHSSGAPAPARREPASAPRSGSRFPTQNAVHRREIDSSMVGSAATPKHSAPADPGATSAPTDPGASSAPTESHTPSTPSSAPTKDPA